MFIEVMVVIIINHSIDILLVVTVIIIVHGVLMLIVIILVMPLWISISLVQELLIRIIIEVDTRVVMLVMLLLLENVLIVDRVAIILDNAHRIEGTITSSVPVL